MAHPVDFKPTSPAASTVAPAEAIGQERFSQPAMPAGFNVRRIAEQARGATDRVSLQREQSAGLTEVGDTGLEPVTSSVSCWHSSQLS